MSPDDPSASPGAAQPGRRIPVSTYRLQLQPAFTFADARSVTPYLARLGVTDLYCSPFFRSRPGSTHGYDVCDFGQLNPELGGDDGFEALTAERTAHGLGLVLDFVPNHMAVEPVLNPWWRDMLEHGPASEFARFFDVDWDPVKPELKGKVLLPFLGDHYGLVLERGELALAYRDGEMVVVYGDMARPIDPKCYPTVLGGIGDDPAEGETEARQEFLSILTALGHLPDASDPDPDHRATRLRESRFARERLARVLEAAPNLRRRVDEAIAAFNGTPGDPDSFDALHELLERQSYRLSYWRTAADEINYRRFFDINQLAGLRVEDETAFRAMHALVLRLIAEGSVTALRLDHIDGLFDPAGYLERLQESARAGLSGEAAARPLYVVVEKILSGNETLPDWPAEGTTGYDFMNDVSRLLVNPRSARALRENYARFTERVEPFSEVVYDCKKLITWTSMAAELNVLAHALDRLSEGDRRARDFTLDSLREALREVAVCFPVYRTYVDPNGISDADRAVIDQAVRLARRRNPAMEASLFDFVRDALMPDRDALADEAYRARLAFAMKFQQYSGPLQAKGIEDTAFYRYNVLISLNEVGGDPRRHGGTIAQFHQANQQRRDRSPRGMLATATHDTKRGEDARTRIHVLSEVPQTWWKRVRRWAAINADCRTTVEGAPAPDRNDELLFYQTLIGCWPAGWTEPTAPADLVPRLQAYMGKATREAKVHTSWITPHEEYNEALARFVEQSLTGPRCRTFLRRFLPFLRRIAHAGMVNSLAQLVLKITSPGVPDFYQGTELWDLSLVDPDNRRPVDYAHRDAMLAALEPWLDDAASSPRPAEECAAFIADLLEHWPDGRIKMFLTACGLRLRREAPDLFLEGDYIPIQAEGDRADHVVAFARRLGDRWVIAVVPRLAMLLTGPRPALPIGPAVWRNTFLRVPAELAAATLRDAFTGAAITPASTPEGTAAHVGDILAACPVALLTVGL